MTTQLPYWLAALYLPNVGPRTLLKWLTHFSNIKSLFEASKEDWLAAGIAPSYFLALAHPDWQSVERDLAWAALPQHHIIALSDADYPCLLKEISDPPLVLYVLGNKSALVQTQIAIVGSRHATPTGLKNATQFAYSLSEAGFVITSGFALGIDAASHRGVIAANGMTIGVAGTGLHHLYPSSHRSLLDEVLKCQGALISEFPLPTPPAPSHFPRRNRLISGLSTGLLVVEAALKSGSLITARHAVEQGREVFAIPGSIHQPLARGCHYLLGQGAKLVETAMDIIEELGPLGAVVRAASLSSKDNGALIPGSNEDYFSTLSTETRQILDLIEYEITPMNMILLRSRLTAGEVSSILLTLELNGYIQTVSGGYVREIPK